MLLSPSYTFALPKCKENVIRRRLKNHYETENLKIVKGDIFCINCIRINGVLFLYLESRYNLGILIDGRNPHKIEPTYYSETFHGKKEQDAKLDF